MKTEITIIIAFLSALCFCGFSGETNRFQIQITGAVVTEYETNWTTVKVFPPKPRSADSVWTTEMRYGKRIEVGTLTERQYLVFEFDSKPQKVLIAEEFKMPDRLIQREVSYPETRFINNYKAYEIQLTNHWTNDIIFLK